jgi:hypothetical protein
MTKAARWVPDWQKADLEALRTAIDETDWVAELEEKSGVEALECLQEKNEFETEICVPKKIRRVANRPAWMNKNI